MARRKKKNKSVVKCKNCGCSCTSNFCPSCGQSTKEKRLETKTFFVGLISRLTYINRGFLFTAWRLLTQPWTVIRDYVQCRRIKYTPPVSMLVIVCVLSAFVSGLMLSEPPGEIIDTGTAHAPLTHMLVLAITDLLMNNMIVRNLTIYIPALLAIPIVYSSAGASKYNLAEYLTAMIYMTSSFMLFGIIVSPFSRLSEFWSSVLEFAYTILICSVSMYKAFPVESVKKRIGLFVLYLFVSGLLYLLIIAGVVVFLGLGKGGN